MEWVSNRRSIAFDRPLVMGIVNVTPDSFSDGGRWATADLAIEHALRLAQDGADVLDIGGESSRPGAEPVPEEEELRRVVPVVRALATQLTVPISIDTMKPAVAQACIEAGAEIINDVSGLRNPAMVGVARDTAAAVLVMHMKGTPQTMQLDPNYLDVVGEIDQYFEERLRTLTASGIARQRLAIDPGIGFGKKSSHNWELLAKLDRLRCFERPLCLGVSRKGFLGKERPAKDRLIAGLTVAVEAMTRGTAQIIRTHDVRETRDSVDTLLKIQQARNAP